MICPGLTGPHISGYNENVDQLCICLQTGVWSEVRRQANEADFGWYFLFEYLSSRSRTMYIRVMVDLENWCSTTIDCYMFSIP